MTLTWKEVSKIYPIKQCVNLLVHWVKEENVKLHKKGRIVNSIDYT